MSQIIYKQGWRFLRQARSKKSLHFSVNNKKLHVGLIKIDFKSKATSSHKITLKKMQQAKMRTRYNNKVAQAIDKALTLLVLFHIDLRAKRRNLILVHS